MHWWSCLITKLISQKGISPKIWFAFPYHWWRETCCSSFIISPIRWLWGVLSEKKRWRRWAPPIRLWFSWHLLSWGFAWGAAHFCPSSMGKGTGRPSGRPMEWRLEGSACSASHWTCWYMPDWRASSGLCRFRRRFRPFWPLILRWFSPGLSPRFCTIILPTACAPSEILWYRWCFWACRRCWMWGLTLCLWRCFAGVWKGRPLPPSCPSMCRGWVFCSMLGRRKRFSESEWRICGLNAGFSGHF